MLQHEKMSRVDVCQRKFMKIDIFAQPFRLILPDGENKYRSFLGSLLSLLTAILLVGYGAYKIQELASNSDYKIQIQDQRYYYDAADEFTFEDHGFMIAAAITAYDGSPDDITDPEIGEVKFVMKRWGGDVLLEFTELPTVPCKDITSFGKNGEEEKQLFNPLSPDSIDQFNIYGPKLLCLKNTDDLRIKGNYDSSQGAQLMVIFEKCNPQARAKKGLRCKTDAEIDQWLEFKYLFVIENGR